MRDIAFRALLTQEGARQLELMRTQEVVGLLCACSYIGKSWLVSKMQALLQGGRLHLPDTSEARVLADELLDYEIRV